MQTRIKLPSTISHWNKAHGKLVVKFYANPPTVTLKELEASDHIGDVLKQDRIVSFRNAMEPWVPCD